MKLIKIKKMIILENFTFITSITLVIFGIYILIFQRNLIKIVLGLNLIEYGVNLYLVSLGYKMNAIAPIFTLATKTNMVLPTPQALTLTSIVIGFATTSLLLSLIILIWKHYGTIDSGKISEEVRKNYEFF